MKKLLAAFLALITISSVALVACKKDKNPSSDGGGNDGGDGFEFVNTSPSTSDTGTETTDTGDDDNTPSEAFENVNVTVWAMWDIKIRSATSGTYITKNINAKTALTAVAKSSKWYKLNYENATWYVPCDYVTTTESDATFTALDTPLTITLKVSTTTSVNQINLRVAPLFGKNIERETVKQGEEKSAILATEKNGSGTWYKVTYNEKTYFFAATSATLPYVDGIPNSGDNFVE